MQVTLTMVEENTRLREVGNLTQIQDNYPKYVITWNDPFDEGDWEGIHHLNILDFLLKVN